MRGHTVRQIELANAIFLTSDAALSRFDFQEMAHKDDQTVSEVILDRLLTNILWLKMPHSKPTLKSIIASHSRNLFIKTRIWHKFYDVLSQLKRDGEVKDENISMLFYHGYIEESLSHYEEHETDIITPEFVLEQIAEAAKLHEEEVERRVKAKESEFLQQLEQVRTRTNRIQLEESLQKDREWLEKLQQIKSNIKDKAKDAAGKRILACRISTALVLAIPFIYVIITSGLGPQFDKMAKITAVVVFIIGAAIGSVGKIWDRLKQLFWDRIYFKRIAEAGLDKIT